MMARCIIVVLATAAACGGDLGTDAPDASPGIPACTNALASMLTPAPGTAPGANSGAYQVPDAQRLSALASSIRAAQLDEADAVVRAAADQAEYHVCRDTAAHTSLIWTPRVPTRGDAYIALRASPVTQLIIEVPHAFFELGTRDEGLLMFEQLGARALIVAGAHRCANAGAPSGCDGTTSVCGGAAPYSISDAAHTETSMFHAAHVAVAESSPGDLVVNLHGMSAQGIHVSNGTTNATTADTPVARFTAALSQSFTGHPVLTCNEFPDALTTTSLCGTTNVQGRHLNGASAACTTAASASSDRFIHLEQSRAVRDRATDVADALSSIL